VIVGEYRLAGEKIDIVARQERDDNYLPEHLPQTPLAYRTRNNQVGTVPLSSVVRVTPGEAPQEIRRIEEQRAVTLLVTPPDEVPLEVADQTIRDLEKQLREQGQIPPTVQINLAGSADKLSQVREALLGKTYPSFGATFASLFMSRMFLALLVTYLLMAALFESFTYPLVIMFSVPLATVGGFMGLAIVHAIVPTQQLDVLTMLGFVILIGVVVNNAILIVHQALNFMRGTGEVEGKEVEKMPPREAIRESVRTRTRPIFMTTLTSVCGMLPLVLMPGSGSELYRGLGSVVVGGLVVATLFTLIVVPLLFSLVLDLRQAIGFDR
jgi:HAE1 family hydrophobic/amphiphilic exporter-1